MRRKPTLFTLCLLLAATYAEAASNPYRLADLNSAPPTAAEAPNLRLNGGFGAVGTSFLLSAFYDSPEYQCVAWKVDGKPSPEGAVTFNAWNGSGSCFRRLATLGDLAIGSTYDDRLWRSDGTKNGIYPLTDAALYRGDLAVLPAPPGGSPRLFFSACTRGAYACSLWSSDGTREGTSPVGGRRERSFQYARSLFAWRGKLYFIAAHGEHGAGLWASDGTAEGTQLVADFDEPYDSPTLFAGTPSRLYFMQGVVNEFLWVSDGTAGGTRKIKDLGAASCDHWSCYGYTDFLGLDGDGILFAAEDEDHAVELWRSDGTPEGTARISDLPDDATPDATTARRLAGGWVFAVRQGDRQALWVSSGDPASSAPLAGCPGGCPALEASFPESASPSGWLLFVGADPEHGAELWSTDGTAQGTRRLTDACPGPCSALSGGGQPFVDPGLPQLGRSYFNATVQEGSDGSDPVAALWSTDGTPAGTRRLLDRAADALAVAGDRIYLATLGGGGAPGLRLWSSDGSAAGTRLAAEPLVAGRSGGSLPRFWPARRGTLLLSNEGDHQQLYRTDGTPEGTLPLAGVDGDFSSAYFSDWSLQAGPWTFFEHTRVKNGGAYYLDELWRSDGTAGETRPLARLERGSSIDTEVLADWNGSLLFLVFTPHACTFWSSDGSAQGTREILPMPAGVRCPTAVQPFGSGFLFVARIERGGGPVPQIFVSDGTPAGTRQLSGVQQTREPLYYARFAQVRGAAYVLLAGWQHETTELWVTDGTAAGTRRVTPDLDRPLGLFADRGSLYFTAALDSDDYAPRGLFRWQPSAARPELLGAVDPGGHDFSVYAPDATEPAPAGDLLFFLGRDSQGVALWRTDGTREGTRAVRAAGGAPFDASGLVAGSGRVFFTAHDEEHGFEPWTSDGTPEGTRRVADLRPGFLSSRAGYLPSGLAVAAGHLLFAADDGVTGMEPWALALLP